MICSNDTHEIICTACKHTGDACPEAMRLVSTLAYSLALVAPLTAIEFEVQGHARLTGCSRTCMAQFVANHIAVRVYCDVAEDAAVDDLEDLADAFLMPTENGNACSPLLKPECINVLPSCMAQAKPRTGEPETSLAIATPSH